MLSNDDILANYRTTAALAVAVRTVEIADTMGSAQGVVDGLRGAGSASGEPLWQLPLAPVYRPQLDSPAADQRNVAPVGIPDGLIAARLLLTYARAFTR